MGVWPCQEKQKEGREACCKVLSSRDPSWIKLLGIADVPAQPRFPPYDDIGTITNRVYDQPTLVFFFGIVLTSGGEDGKILRT